MKYRVRHITEYSYNNPVSMCYNIAHIIPRNTHKQSRANNKVTISPSPDYQRKRRDYFGNTALYFSVQMPHKKLTIDITTEIDIKPLQEGWSLDLGPSCQDALNIYRDKATPEIRQVTEYQMSSPMIVNSSELAEFARSVFTPEKSLMRAVRDLTEKIFTEFTFDPASTNIATPLKEVLENKRGVCQDFAHFAIGCLRSLGFPARYVSGYIETLPPPGQKRLVGADASHAWFSVYIPTIGWFDCDPTNNNIPNEQHIVTAWGRDYSDVTPLQGVIFEGGDCQTLKVSVDVERLG